MASDKVNRTGQFRNKSVVLEDKPMLSRFVLMAPKRIELLMISQESPDLFYGLQTGLISSGTPVER